MAETKSSISWSLGCGEGGIGTGNWKHFPVERLPDVWVAAENWRSALFGIDKPWLCWCVDPEWCWLQQQLVAAAGWTPVVGTDGRFARPRVMDSAVFVDFNQDLALPIMWMHFPVEFAHLYCDKLAFWHSDVLPPLSVVEQIAEQFDRIRPGEVIAVNMEKVSLRQRVRRLLKGTPVFYKRWFELIACTTRDASRGQFESGCGWWRSIKYHPNFDSATIRRAPHYEHGVGIWFWQQYFGGNVQPLRINAHPFHYSTNHPRYRRRKDTNGKLKGSKYEELTASFHLAEIIGTLGLGGINTEISVSPPTAEH